MRFTKVCALLLVASSALAACDRTQGERGNNGSQDPHTAPSDAPPVRPFKHSTVEDLSGDYRSLDASGSGWRVESLFIGQIETFQSWEAGSRSHPPLVLTIVGPKGREHLKPSAYTLSDERLVFRSEASQGQALQLDVRIDPSALATARRNLGDRTTVVVGHLAVGDETSPVNLSWWFGD